MALNNKLSYRNLLENLGYIISSHMPDWELDMGDAKFDKTKINKWMSINMGVISGEDRGINSSFDILVFMKQEEYRYIWPLYEALDKVTEIFVNDDPNNVIVEYDRYPGFRREEGSTVPDGDAVGTLGFSVLNRGRLGDRYNCWCGHILVRLVFCQTVSIE